MPTYEYRCHFCRELTDAFQKMSDPPLTKCPHCGKEGLERIVSGGAGVIYKGEGWYVTDYSKKSSGGKETPKAPATSSEAKSSTETKPSAETKPSTRASSSPPKES